ncbi:Glycoside hydrolase family 31 [Macrophomina phaseolina MS6]|uniref:alpha-glucosidase n=1 Tax=Macrophomina phaseolina (strain MS6) TaxID=1126212 RepID=K2QSR8_MACPH|nr:Glycoside hydrolase family 31 [Macrophomina phaseolina MS6]
MPDATIGTQDENHPKHRDPYRFIPADEFFDRELLTGTVRPDSVTFSEKDQLDATGKKLNPACGHGRVFRLSTGAVMLIQFMRPLVWRIRFYPHYKEGHDFTDYNTRTIIRGNLSNMIDILDRAEGITWSVQFDDSNPRYYILRSVDGNGKPVVQLWIQRDPFRIIATRTIKTPGKLKMHVRDDEESHLPITAPAESGQAVIWKTKKRPLQYQVRGSDKEPCAIVLSVEKPDPARFMGFGEQGGKDLFKDNTFMNYFNFDNMRYNNVYGRGPFEDAEPLYHSEPYFIEVNGHPGYMSQLATFIDNYSHVCVDLGKTNTTQVRIATRFNGFQGIFIAGNDISEVIRRYSSLIGRPRLMPRFVLGNHQGCYGYDHQQRVEQAVQKYRDYGIPLDGMHIDVDMQRDYRTFTIDKGKFPEPEKMFLELRKKGVRCSTNITPVINANNDADYTTLNDGLANNHFVLDRRNIDPSAPNWFDQRYMQYGGSQMYYTRPFVPSDAEEPDDNHDFSASFNKADQGQLFRGGVSYGNKQGCPGYYPNLNQRRTRDWWGKQYEYLFNTGLEFVWQDMTSPCMAQRYGDMKSWPFRLMLDSDGWPGETKALVRDPDQTDQKAAIEIWSLYSFNLHKATFKGLNHLDCRKGKRNFIIGRGSYAGAQRYAGLWTGDNASTWDFLQISVAQVIALGLAGVTIAGADVGGFEPPEGDLTAFADPELLIRWYCAYSLLPWFRNHYSAKHTGKENIDWKKKDFQEPYRYDEWYREHWREVMDGERYIYESVLPVSRYYIRLRYSLLQLLYDAMFENSITGLPIARSLVITDPLDGSLFSRHEWANKSQYMVRNDILVAPQLEQKRARREIYFPSTNSWFPLNLRPHYDDGIGEPLQPRVQGGANISYDCHIAAQDGQLPYVCPMYIREGAIIPQIQVRDCVPDRTRPELPSAPANPITINIYPGHSSRGPSKYSMYLDDGVSRSSAPDDAYLFLQPTDAVDEAQARPNNEYGDKAARSNFRRVDIEQVITDTDDAKVTHRRIKLFTYWKGSLLDPKDAEKYDDAQVKRDVGDEYRLVIWHEAETDMSKVSVSVVRAGTNDDRVRVIKDVGKKASMVWVPTEKHVEAEVEVKYE